jgi:two-component system, NarL family, capsular synthesis sensor histidine kinase RcsC
MERFFAASQDSPLQMLRMLETNLKRERHIFAVVVALLIFAAICGASAAYCSILTSTLKREQLAAQTVTRDINQAIFSRYDIITTGSLVLGLSAKEALPAQVRPRGNDDECTPMLPGREHSTLRDACLAAR